MKKLLFTIFLGVLPFLAVANTTDPQDTFEVDGNKVKKTSYHEDGQVKEIAHFEWNGRRVTKTSYYADGTLKEVGSYFKGKLVGQWRSYGADGELRAIAYYKNGKKDGIWTFFNQNEVMTVEYLDNSIVNTVAIR